MPSSSRRYSVKGTRQLKGSAKRRKCRIRRRVLVADDDVPLQQPVGTMLPQLQTAPAENHETGEASSSVGSANPTPCRKRKLFVRKRRTVNAGLLKYRQEKHLAKVNSTRETESLNCTSNVDLKCATEVFRMEVDLFSDVQSQTPTELFRMPPEFDGLEGTTESSKVPCINTMSDSQSRQETLEVSQTREEITASSQTVENITDVTLPDIPIIRLPNPCQNLDVVKGVFVVDGFHLLNEIRSLELHKWKCMKSDIGYMKLKSSNNKSLNWRMVFECPYCLEQKTISATPPTNKTSPPTENIINTTEESHPLPPREHERTAHNLSLVEKAVWGFISIGGGHRNMEEVFSTMGMNCMTQRTFKNYETKLGEKWCDILLDSMIEAGKEEKRLALENGDVDKGVPYITVVVDGGWSHRSHGHRYDANSGVACIIGLRTKKLLYADVRNKYCFACAFRERNGLPPGHPNCYKNWDGPSSSMEADVIVQGFNMSETMHGLQYRKIVADGDSSVFMQIRQKVPYGLKVKKYECANHVVKNYTKRLFNIQKNCKQRKVLSNNRIAHLKGGARMAIVHNSKNGDVESLKKDLKNGPHHVFGNHLECREYFCSHPKVHTPLSAPEMQVLAMVQEALKPVLLKAGSLITNNTSNLAETFMSIMAKFSGGKQVNRGQRGSYYVRSRAAGLDFQHGPMWHPLALRKVAGKTPPSIVKRVATRRLRKAEAARKSQKNNRKPRRKLDHQPKSSKHQGAADYGPLCQRLDIDDHDLQMEKDAILASLQVDVEKRDDIEKQTRGQSENPLWFAAREKRITASNFGKICKRRPSSKWAPLVNLLIYKVVTTDAMEYGRIHEMEAIKAFERKTGKTVEPCGLFVDLTNGFMGASPDGVIAGESAIVEVKCPKSACDLTIREASMTLKSFYIDPKTIKLKRNHDYYYQIIGQLHISGLKKCYFIVWTKKDLHIEEIVPDPQLWTAMSQKLCFFYKEAFLPEIIDPRIARSMEIREPPPFSQK